VSTLAQAAEMVLGWHTVSGVQVALLRDADEDRLVV
jgi:hypothetical protein